MTDQPHPTPSDLVRPPIRRRASAFHDAERAASLRGRWLRIAAVAALALVLTAATVGSIVASGLSSLPNDAVIATPLPSDTMIYDRTGQVLLADLHPSGYQHYQTPLGSLGSYLPAATVAIEDANFWHEPGVDPISIGRAAVADVRAGAPVQGGS